MTQATGAAHPGVADALVRVSHVVDRAFTEVARRHELTPQQTHLLCHLAQGPVGMGDLGRLLDLEKSSLTGLIDRVERRGLAERVRDDRDRRACRIALTEEGRRLSRLTHREVNERLDGLVASLGPEEQSTLNAVAQRLLTESGATPS